MLCSPYMKKSGAFLLFLFLASTGLLATTATTACGGRVESVGDGALGATSTTPPPSAKKPQKTVLPDTEPEENEPNVCPNGDTISDAAIEQEIGSSYKGPAARASACSDVDIANFNVNVNGPTTSFADLEKSLSDDCKACVFTKTSAEAWGPIVLLDARPNEGFINFGACFAAATGEMGCGKAVQYAEFCRSNACSDCATQDTLNACYAKADSTTCKGAHDAALAKCDAAASTKCGTSIFEHVQYLCALRD